MTAQAPYESLPVLPHTTYNGFADGSEPLYTAEQMRAYARAALAALPERTPVSAGGDAVAWQYRWRISANREWSNWTECDDPANHPEERGNPNCEFRALYATPAPPVGADWVVVPRVATDAMLLALFGSGVRHQFNVGTDEQRAEIMRNVRDTYEAMIAAAPTPAEARGVGDGVRALVAKWRAEANGTDILDCSKSGLMNYCADELEAALAANTRQAQAQGSEPWGWAIEFHDPDPQFDVYRGKECPEGWAAIGFPLYTANVGSGGSE